MNTENAVFHWWEQLTPKWKQAFAEACLGHSNHPTETELDGIMNAPVLSFAGPTAPDTNVTVQLDDLSGVEQLSKLEVLVATHHKIETVRELSASYKLSGLFLFNNQLKSIEGIEELTNLRQLYLQCNNIQSIKPVEKLINLDELYVYDNALTSLEGLTREHSGTLEKFFCIPNKDLKQKDLLFVERELGIRCRSL